MSLYPVNFAWNRDSLQNGWSTWRTWPLSWFQWSLDKENSLKLKKIVGSNTTDKMLNFFKTTYYESIISTILSRFGINVHWNNFAILIEVWKNSFVIIDPKRRVFSARNQTFANGLKIEIHDPVRWFLVCCDPFKTDKVER